jgi:phosphate transport system permease protein
MNGATLFRPARPAPGGLPGRPAGGVPGGPADGPPGGQPAVTPRRSAGARLRTRARASLLAHGEPMIWVTGGALAVALAMISGLLFLVLLRGTATFWPSRVVELQTREGGRIVGEITRHESYRPQPPQVPHPAQASQLPPPSPAAGSRSGARVGGAGAPPAGGPATAAEPAGLPLAHRRLVRTGNFDLTGIHFVWVDDEDVAREERPPWAVTVERMAWGRFIGSVVAFQIDGQDVTVQPEQAWEQFRRYHGEVRARWRRRHTLEQAEVGRINRACERARLRVRQAELDQGAASAPAEAAAADYARARQSADQELTRLQERAARLDAENARYALVLGISDGQRKSLPLADIVRAYPANRLTWPQRLAVYLDRWREFLAGEPREANSEGGVFPALFGTVVMTLVMTLAVVPFGVLAALYLREYAKAGPVVSAVRIAVNNLAGVPSIVFGVFGLGFFCYALGAHIDQLFFAARLPNPTFGKGGVLWSSLTLALLTLPVVIVATEEALAAVPGSMREGSYACGASKWQTIRRIILPRALPGIMTGMILAMARGAGEVAPLMLVGAVKLAPELPVDGVLPFVHLERSFMHLGFHIFDLGFQSQNSEAAKPMVFTTTLLLIAVVAALNVGAVQLRARLRRRFVASHF